MDDGAAVVGASVKGTRGVVTGSRVAVGAARVTMVEAMMMGVACTVVVGMTVEDSAPQVQ